MKQTNSQRRKFSSNLQSKNTRDEYVDYCGIIII